MNFKILFGSTTLIVSLVTTIALLGSSMDLINQLTGSIAEVPSIQSVNVYCGTDTDCKQDPNDCSKCVNILAGGFTLMSKCSDDPISCECVNNKCTVE